MHYSANPLLCLTAAILGLLQIADEFSSLEEKTELIKMIEVSASKLDGTIKDMHRNLVQFNLESG